MVGKVFGLLPHALQERLLTERLRIDSNTHRGELKADVQNSIPHHDVSVEASERGVAVGGPPVIVVSSSIVMGSLRSWKGMSDTNDKDSAVFFSDSVLSLLGSEVRESLLELLCVHEGNLIGQLAFSTVFGDHGLFDLDESLIDFTDGLLKVGEGSVLSCDCLLPIKLKHVD